MAENLLRAILKKACEKHGCPFEILTAIVTVESSWDPWAIRYEPNYGYLSSPNRFARLNKISVETEEILQKSSWGLGQIMGGSAREVGFVEPLTMLTIPEVNLEVMCLFYKRYCLGYATDNEQIAAYNAGTPKKIGSKFVNQKYVNKVRAVITENRLRVLPN